MASISLSTGVSIGGISITGAVTRGAELQIGIDIELPAAQLGELTTRTDNDTGIFTLNDSAVPTVTTSDTVTVSWNTGARHGMTVTAIGANTISVDGGSGDNLPTVNTENVIIAEESTLDVNLTGNDIVVFAVSSPTLTYMDFQEASGTTPSITAFDQPAGEGFMWWEDSQFDNPFETVNLGSLIFANLDETTTALVSGGILYDAAP